MSEDLAPRRARIDAIVADIARIQAGLPVDLRHSEEDREPYEIVRQTIRAIDRKRANEGEAA